MPVFYSFLSRSIFFDGNLETAMLDREKLRSESEYLWERFRDDLIFFFFFLFLLDIARQTANRY